MNVRTLLSVGLIAIAMVALPAFCTTTSAQSMNGTWEVTGGALYGKPIPANVAYTMTLKVADNAFVANSGNLTSSGTVTANPQANPQQVTFSIDNGNDPGRKLMAIYKFEGQLMTITFSESDQFPTTFDSTSDNKFLTLNYQIGTGRAGLAQSRSQQPKQVGNVPPGTPKKTDGGNSAAAF